MTDIYAPPKSSEQPEESLMSDNNSGAGEDSYPDGIRGWCWGGFCFGWIWGIANGTFVSLLGLIPYVGFIIQFWLGFSGRKMAWRNKRWQSVEHFNRVQKRWSIAAAIIYGGLLVLILFFFTMGLLNRPHNLY